MNAKEFLAVLSADEIVSDGLCSILWWLEIFPVDGFFFLVDVLVVDVVGVYDFVVFLLSNFVDSKSKSTAVVSESRAKFDKP